MFKLEFIVEDKDLAKVMHAVAGVALNMSVPQPVANAKAERGKVKAMSKEGTMTGRVVELLRTEYAGKIIDRDTVKNLMNRAGGNPSGIGTVMTHLTKNELVKPESRGVYSVPA